MKKNILTGMLPVAVCMAFTTVHAIAGPGPVQPTLTTIQGTTDNEKATKLSLYAVVEGQTKEVASTEVNADHAFAFALQKPAEGFYYISAYPKDLGTRIYLKSGDQLNLAIEGHSFKQKTGSAENKSLQQWNEVAAPIMSPAYTIDSVTFHSYFPKLEATQPKIAAFKKSFTSTNKSFSALMKVTMDADIEYAAMRLLLTPRSDHPKKEQYPAFYNTIVQDKKFCDANYIRLGNINDYMQIYNTFQFIIGDRTAARPAQAELLAKKVNGICNDRLKALALLNSMGAYKSLDELTTAMAPYQQYFSTPLEKQRYNDYEKSIRKFNAGEAGYNFIGEDVNGNKVAFNDLKGKVVVVDVWATWCGPCKAELPHLKHLEEEMEGKNVTFVGASVDEAKDKEKWKTFVHDQEMKGTQIFMSGWSEVTKFYDIKGIPRFMVFDQQGKIVTIDAPRPSTPELKALIEKLLAKG
ncbi:TlpA disulfide reductase family protein [Chitinophaga sp. Cy-1792]|uniref:TlpA disulfide reductase family protein n=1 Tax=Chitinophaga sp. Cy-1792 TaxID=2608339 RepID=UPI00141FD7E6|nr:TlpA disulfide reductase family protein [Chitinophaga sp. Cy-1792]NIG52361.1 AhpC/TSA family protein [Chitinophaga sp. Cy-1792]